MNGISITISVGSLQISVEETHFIRARNNAWELAFLLILPFDDSFDNTGMIGAQVDKAKGYAGLEARSQLWQRSHIGRSKRTSHSASRKANEAVYLVGGISTVVVCSVQRVGSWGDTKAAEAVQCELTCWLELYCWL